VYRRPDDLGEALRWLAVEHPAVLAGGTDFYPARVDRPAEPQVLDLSRIAEMRGIARVPSGWRIGALATWTEVATAALPPWMAALQRAAREVGGPQTQNRGTLGGNLCNASPAADGVPVLLALDAQVELAASASRRTLRLADFVLGPRCTARAADELLVAVHLPDRPAGARSAFVKLGHRRYLVISVAMVAAVLDLDGSGRVASAAVAVGACSPVARRLHALEELLAGAPRTEVAALAGDALSNEADRLLSPLSPIDDVRGTAAYRRDAVATLVVRALREAAA
jgi:CO/xanthine dehydrogenase FAD-binding subunit